MDATIFRHMPTRSTTHRGVEQAMRELSFETRRRTRGWSPAVIGALDVFEWAVSEASKALLPTFRGLVMDEDASGNLSDLTTESVARARAFAMAVRDIVNEAYIDVQSSKWIESFWIKDIMPLHWLDRADVLDSRALIVSFDSVSSTIGMPGQYLLSIFEMRNAALFLLSAMDRDLAMDSPALVVARCASSAQSSGMMVELAATAQTAYQTRSRTDEEASAILRRLRWQASGGKPPFRGNPKRK